MASEIRVKLLKLVLDNPEIKRDDIRAHKALEDEDDKTLASLLYNTKKDEQIVADEGGRYTITAKGRAYLKEAGVEIPVGKASTRGSVKAKDSSGRPGPAVDLVTHVDRKFVQPLVNKTAHAIAEQLLQDSQAALDRYIASVCDPDVLGRFRAQRDQARALVESFNGTTEQPGVNHE